MRFPGVLAQAIYPQASSGRDPLTASELDGLFYAALRTELDARAPSSSKTVEEAKLRKMIRFECIRKDDNSSLISVSAWGNAFQANDEQLKQALQAAIDVLEDAAGTGVKIKMLNIPKL